MPALPPSLARPGPPQPVTVLVGCVVFLILALGLRTPGTLTGLLGVLGARLVQARLRATTRAVPPVEP